jgi:predicted lipid-binding transport protein (Tim44 family)
VFVGGGGGGGGGGGAGIIGLVVLVVIVLTIFVIYRAAKRRGWSGRGAAGGVMPPMAPLPGGPVAPPPGPGAPVATPAASTNGVAAGLDAIRAHDPGFDEARFVADAERAFFTVQEAWTELKPEMSRRVMADGIWQQHRVQIEDYVGNHKRNVLEGLAVANASIVGARSDDSFDTITLRIRAGCADYDVDVSRNDKIVRGSKDFTEWTEDWQFQRSAGATTKVDGGTMAARCPNCGAPLDVDLQGTCKYCHQAVMSGRYDWVLTRIEQVTNGSARG